MTPARKGRLLRFREAEKQGAGNFRVSVDVVELNDQPGGPRGPVAFTVDETQQAINQNKQSGIELTDQWQRARFSAICCAFPLCIYDRRDDEASVVEERRAFRVDVPFLLY